MAISNDLAIELQEAIWELVLPASRGVHWIEIEGIPQDADYIRDSIRMTQSHRFDRMPEKFDDVSQARRENPGWNERTFTNIQTTTPFFRFLLTTVPALFGQSKTPKHEVAEGDLADEVAYTYRCRQLSTYSLITTLLVLCRLSRNVAMRYIRSSSRCSWPLHRSKGLLYRPRPMDIWEAQHSSDTEPPVARKHRDWKLLRPRIQALDLVVFRLHDSHGRATPLLQHGPWQYFIEDHSYTSTFGCFDRIGLEWNPLWASVGGRGELRPENIQSFMRSMSFTYQPVALYWLVDGLPRPDWNRDYPTVVQDIFAGRMAEEQEQIQEHLNKYQRLKPEDRTALIADHHLGQEFEANGRRYYIVFVVFSQFSHEETTQLEEAGLYWSGPFPGSAALWPEALREPVRLAYDIHLGGSASLGTYLSSSYILSWEPTG